MPCSAHQRAKNPSASGATSQSRPRTALRRREVRFERRSVLDNRELGRLEQRVQLSPPVDAERQELCQHLNALDDVPEVNWTGTGRRREITRAVRYGYCPDPKLVTRCLYRIVMTELLQLHIVAPPLEDEQTEAVFELLSEHGFVDVRDGDYVELTAGTEFSSQLFERRDDNLARVDALRDGLASAVGGDVFRAERRVSFDYAEGRSVADPDAHLLLRVANRGATPSTVRWRDDTDTLDAPPRVDDTRVYHTDGDTVTALDGATGTVAWETPVEGVIQAPEVGAGLVTACTGWTVAALEPETGAERWRTAYDQTEANMIDARVAIADDGVFLGFRDGRVDQLSPADGSPATVATFDGAVVELTPVDAGMLVRVTEGGLALLAPDGTVRWTTTHDSIHNARYNRYLGGRTAFVRDGVYYTGTMAGVAALSLADGTVRWTAPLGRDAETRAPFVFDDHHNRSLGTDAYISTPRTVCWADGGLIVHLDEALLVLDPATGAIERSLELGVDHESWEDPVVALATTGDRLLWVDHEDRLHVCDPAGTEAGTVQLGFDPGVPVPFGDAIVCRVGTELLCLEDLPTTP